MSCSARGWPSRPGCRAGALSELLLHRLRQSLRALAQRVERAALRVDGAVGVAFAEIAFGVAHRFAGAAELVQFALPWPCCLAGPADPCWPKPRFFRSSSSLLSRSRNACWLCRSSPIASPCCWPCAALLALLLAALAVLPALILALAEGAVAQLLLLADHVAELVELRHHVVAVVAVHVRRRHLQVLHHLLELLQKLPGRILGAVARQVLQPVEHVLQVLLAQHARIAVERPGELLIVLNCSRIACMKRSIAARSWSMSCLISWSLAPRSSAWRSASSALRNAGLRVGNVAVLDADRHRPQPRHHVAQIVVGLGAHQRPEDRAQSEIDAGARA